MRDVENIEDAAKGKQNLFALTLPSDVKCTSDADFALEIPFNGHTPANRKMVKRVIEKWNFGSRNEGC